MQVMKHEELVEFITNKMSMQHTYQPLLIKTLVECGGSVTVRQIAQAVLSNDESQLHYYEQRIKFAIFQTIYRSIIKKTEVDRRLICYYWV